MGVRATAKSKAYDICLCGNYKRTKSVQCEQCRYRRPEISQPEDESIRLIALTRGKVAIVDASDYEWLMQWKWHTVSDKSKTKFYAACSQHRSDGRWHTILMHREVLRLSCDDSRMVDHIESLATLDNRKSNLRIATATQNVCNKVVAKNNKCGLKGARLDPRRGRWYAEIRKDRKTIFLGSFSTPEEAHAAYAEAAKQYHGEFARAQ